jgi:transcriptional regulator with GAF, ATPase, and Fis domain
MPGVKGQGVVESLAGDGVTAEQVVISALERAHGSVTEAARSLGLERTSLWYYLWKFGLETLPREIRDRVRRTFVL